MGTPKFCRNPDGRAYSTIPGSGRRRVYFGEHGAPAAESAYKRWLAQVLRIETQPQPLPVVTNGTTVADLAAPFLDHAIGYYAKGGEPTAEYRNVRDSLSILLAYSGKDLAGAFGPNDLRDVRDAMIRDGWTTPTGKHRRYSRAYVNSTFNRILRFFRWCESRELVARGTAASLRTVEPLRRGKSKADERPPVEAVEWAVAAATLPYCRDDLAALIQVQYWCGMRPSEACHLSAQDLDRSGSIWLYRVPEHKTSHYNQRLVKAVPEQAQAILLPFMARSASDAAPLFLTRFGRAYTATAYGKAVGKAIAAAARAGVTIPHWSPNQLRHTIAEMVDAIAGREAAQHYLGHSRPDTTAIYAGRNEAVLRRVAEDLGRSAESARPA